MTTLYDPALKLAPHPIDIAVGQNLRQLRIFRGLSQRQVAESVGITIRQWQKYETAVNRISASKIVQVSIVLNVPVDEILAVSSLPSLNGKR